MRAALDFSGMNFYGGRTLIAAGESWELLKELNAHGTGRNMHEPGTMERACLWMASRYSRPVEITETGGGDQQGLPRDKAVHDQERIAWLSEAFAGIRRAQLKGAAIRSVHIWSLIDNWEWQDGFRDHLGLAWVDFANPAERVPKDSARWLSTVIKSRRLAA